MRRISLSLLLILSSVIALVAQDPAKESDLEKLKADRRAKIVDAIQVDASELRLPENRAFVSAKVGAAIWKYEPDRAVTLFKAAVANLIAAQSAAEANKAQGQQNYDLLNSQSLRPTVLNAIAATNAELALDSLFRTRPLAVQRALVQGSTTEAKKISNSSANYPYLAQQEINMEQRFIKLIAEQQPERTIAILKENIKKHLSGETLAMLKKIWEKEPALGNELANDVVDRLIARPFSTGSNLLIDFECINLANALLGEYLRERTSEERAIAFDESRMRSLAAKTLSTYIERGAAIGYVPLQQLEPIAKRFAPALTQQLRKAAENSGGRHGLHVQPDESYAELLKSNPSADTLIAEAKKFPPETRRSMYASAANKLSDAGQYERAVALLSDNFDDDSLENALSSLNWYYAQLLVNRGDFDAAESMMLGFNESNRISALTGLAMTIYRKDPKENRSRAMAILQRVRSHLPDKPETSTEFTQLFQLVTSMASIDPAEAFRNFEPLIDPINQIVEASAVLQRFQGGGYSREGEQLLAYGSNFGVYVDPSLLKTLAENDFARTSSLLNSLSRREMRIFVLTSLLESGL